MKRALALGIMLGMLLTPFVAKASDIEDAEIAKKAAVEWMEKHTGIKKDVDFKIVFQNEVYFEWKENDKIRVYGCVKRGENVLYVTTFDDPWIKERDAFGLKVTKELHRSIIFHEIIHYMLNAYSGRLISNGPSEYVAYSAQIDFLSEETRKEVLAMDDGQFVSDMSINFVTHFNKPHKFGIMSYKHFKDTNGELLKSIMDGTFDPDQSIINMP